jgi:23S rRNA (uracil1939-C5)-methyltransferase
MNNLIGKIVELKIDSIANGGNGIGRYDGIACFVPGTIPGEKVRVQIKTAKKKYMQARLIEVLSASEHRITPECPLALSTETIGEICCPGCQYQHLSYEEEVKVKTQQFKDLLERFAKIDPDGVLKETIPAPKTSNYRNKITLHTNKTKDKLGYYAADNKGILNISNCPLACNEINKTLENFDPSATNSNNSKSIVFRYTKKDGVVTYTDETKNDDLLEEETSIGALKVPLKSFFQINAGARELILKKVTELLKKNPTNYVFDLYSGVGLFAIAAAKAGIPKVYASDIDKKAVQIGKMNANIQECGIKFLALPALSAAKSILCTLQQEKTTVIVDPPRTGLDTQMIKYLSNLSPKNIIYISCGPDTLCRDLKIFKEAGYALKESQIIDMFPRTAHFETVSFLQKQYTY